MIENNLFNEKKMEEFIELYDNVLNVKSPEENPICDWINKLNNNELEDEKKNYVAFFKIILENILGYELEDINYEENIGDEGRPVEFTFKKDEKEYVVVELKGTKTKDLNKRYNREQSAIEQVTNYASIKEETQWAFVSNYNEFRLFNPSYREKYISFQFKSLTDPEVLKKFLLIFSKFSLIDEDIPQTLLKETRIIERELEDEFYQLFSETRLMLIKELEYSSEDIDRHEAIRLATLILNRYIFTCFAEDLKLIPPETTSDVIITPIEKDNLFDFTIWSRLNELFRFIDKGNPNRNISQFNGGLFKENLMRLEIRDFVENSDEFFSECYRKWKFEEKYEDIKDILGKYNDKINPIYKNLLIISSFDFDSELDVNVLGHIFENSIGDIEELKDQTTSRRKKEGVFYTPNYITDYICRNTIIPYLSKTGTSNTVNDLIAEYELTNELDVLDEKLKNIKIIDIACGSGAFLNKAVDVLFEIHKAYHDSKYADNQSLDKFFDDLNSRKEIIVNNIYGVDVNPESVEITKLSLFLKLASSVGMGKGFQLPNLDKNIKCGDSIVDDENVVGEKAFNWNIEFKEILDDRGFDIVVGNPPYVRQEMIKHLKPYLKENYETYTGVADLYVYFFERGLSILKENGFLSFICSNKYAKAKYGLNLRKLLLSSTILKYNDYTGENIFESATVDTSTIILQKKYDNDNKILIDEDFYLNQNKLDKNAFMFDKPEIMNLKNKIRVKGQLIKELDIKINRGVMTGFNKAFVIDEKIKNELINEDYNNLNLIKPLLRGRDINKWQIMFNKLYLLYIPWNFGIEYYSSIEKHLNNFKKELSKRPEVKRGRYNWYCLSRYASDYVELFNEEKIMYAEIVPEPRFVYDYEKYYCDDTTFIMNSGTINLKYLIALLNSKLLFWYFKDIGYNLGGKGYRYKKIFVEQLPIFITEDKDTEMKLSELTDIIIDENKKLINETDYFKKWLKRTFEIDKLSAKLENYYDLSFDEFLKEVKKKKVDTKSRKNQELLETEFNNSLEIIKPLQVDIQRIEQEINQLVYELYDLTDEEIAIVEESLSE